MSTSEVTRTSFLLSPSDVAELLASGTSVVVLDATIARSVGPDGRTLWDDGRAAFESEHLPTAQFADMFSAFSDPGAPFPFSRPSAEQFERAARAAGVRTGSTVVVYDRLGGAWAARLWWVFRSFGFQAVRVLDGGLAAWKSAGLDTAAGEPVVPETGDVRAVPVPGFFVDLPEVRELSQSPDEKRPVVCATRTPEYLGEGAGTRAGHIPNSTSLPYPQTLAEDGTISVERAAAAATAVGLSPDDDQVVLYCGGGINAAGLALALTEVGYANVTIFDGSLNEWRADPTLPLRTGELP